MRDAFAVLFFVSVGMLLDPGALLDVARPGRSARWRSCSSASRSWRSLIVWLMRIRCAAALDRRASRWRRSASSRSSSRARPRARRPDAGSDEHAGRRVDRVDRAEPAAVPRDRAGRAVDRGAAAAVALLNRAGRDPPMPMRSRRRDRADPATAPSSSATARPAGRWCGCCARTASSRPSSSSTSTPCAALRQDGVDAVYGDATRRRHAGGRGRGDGRQPDPRRPPAWRNSTEVIRTARELNPDDPRPGARRLPARRAAAESGRRRQRCFPARAKSRWRSPRPSSARSARRRSRSTASAPGRTSSSSAGHDPPYVGLRTHVGLPNFARTSDSRTPHGRALRTSHDVAPPTSHELRTSHSALRTCFLFIHHSFPSALPCIRRGNHHVERILYTLYRRRRG